jgi:hypothetical protein
MEIDTRASAQLPPPREVDIQRAFFDRVRLDYNRGAYRGFRTIFHPANEGRRGYVGQNAVRAGVQRGVLDVICPGYVFAIEFKSGKNKPTREQTWWMLELQAIGWRVGLVVNDWEDAYDLAVCAANRERVGQTNAELAAAAWLKNHAQDAASPWDASPAVAIRRRRAAFA